MEKGGDLAHKIQRFFGQHYVLGAKVGRDEAPEILAAMGLRPEDAAERAQRALAADQPKDPRQQAQQIEQLAKLKFETPAAEIFRAISELPPTLDATQASVLQQQFLKYKDMQLPAPTGVDTAHLAAQANPTSSIEEKPARSFKGYYRQTFGIDPEMQLARVVKSHV